MNRSNGIPHLLSRIALASQKGSYAIKCNPLLFSLLWRLRETPPMRARVVRSSDALVIEGYPRSANTFATTAFELSQPTDLRVGNHMHSPAQFLLAKKYRIPAMLVLRPPRDACLSFVIFHNGSLSPYQALLRYIWFHRPLLSITNSFVIAPFREITVDFGSSIRRLNERFSTSFKMFEHTDANRDEVFRTIERRRQEYVSAGVIKHDPMKLTKPTTERNRLKREISHLFDDPILHPVLEEAEELYMSLMKSDAYLAQPGS